MTRIARAMVNPFPMCWLKAETPAGRKYTDTALTGKCPVQIDACQSRQRSMNAAWPSVSARIRMGSPAFPALPALPLIAGAARRGDA